MQIIKHNLKVEQEMKKIYVDQHRTHKEIQVWNHFYLRVIEKFRLDGWVMCQIGTIVLWAF